MTRAELVWAVGSALFLLPFLVIGGPAAANGPARVVNRLEKRIL